MARSTKQYAFSRHDDTFCDKYIKQASLMRNSIRKQIIHMIGDTMVIQLYIY